MAERFGVIELTSVVRERIGRYFPELAGHEPRVLLERRQSRRNSTLFSFLVSANACEQRLLVKLPHGPATWRRLDDGAVDDRPRLSPIPMADAKAQLEFTTLSRIRDHFTVRQDARFGAIRVLDFLPERQAVVMEHVPHPSLSRLMMTNCRPALWATNCDPALRNAGAWLRIYHDLPALGQTQDRHTSRDEFVGSLREFVEFLMRASQDSRLVERVAAQIESLAQSVLSEFLPLGMSHGDFAPRNIFVGPGQQVTVFDTLARWRAPIYEDIAHFLVSLKLSRPQVYSFGFAFRPDLIARYEEEFLRGYFDQDEIPLGAIRLYEKLLVLEKWAARVYRLREPRGIFRLAQLGAAALWSRAIRRQLLEPVTEPQAQAALSMS